MLKLIIEKVIDEKNLAVKKMFRNLIYCYFSWISIIFIMKKNTMAEIIPYLIRDSFHGGVVDWLLYIFKNPDLIHLLYPAMVVQVVLLCSGVAFNIHSRIYTFFCFLLTANIMNTVSFFHDGGHMASLVLFANLTLVNTSGIKQKYAFKAWELLTTSLSVVIFFICKIDISLIYLVAAISKLQGDLWANGVALYYILQVDEFYHPFWSNLIIGNDFLITFFTYSTIAWEMSYPFLIWTKKGRIPMVIIAIFFHLGTVMIMGLTTFGVGMACWNLVMLKDRDVMYLKKGLTFFTEAVLSYAKRKKASLEQKIKKGSAP